MLVVVFSVLLTYVSQPNRRCAFFTWNFLKSDGESPGRIVEKEMCVGAKSGIDSCEGPTSHAGAPSDESVRIRERPSGWS